jgi:hypothetical protein
VSAATTIALANARARQSVSGLGAGATSGPISRLAARYWWTIPLTAAASYASYRMRGKTHKTAIVLDVTIVLGALASLVALIELEASKPQT